MRRRVALVLVGLALVAGCSDGATPDAVPAPARTTGSPAAASTAYHQYVALGDSYTAAPLVPPTDTSTICLRSRVNYPALLARAMPGTALTDVSCSGATTANTTEPQSGQGGSVPPQLDAVRPRTDLVTIGLGGNDHALFATTLGQCTHLASTDPTGSPCTEAVSGGQALGAVLADIRGNIAGVVRDARARSPEARIVVVGYPQIVPGSGSCDLLPLATGDYDLARSVNEGLARAVRRGAREAGAEFLDLWGPTAGHDICAADPWINGRITSASTALAYHPLAVEQRAVADLLLRKLSARRAPAAPRRP